MSYVNYYQYLNSSYWYNLKNKLITKRSRCWICGSKLHLLLHHESYDNLYHEKLGRDLVIVCEHCHTKIHYILWIKTPIKTIYLRKIRYLLRLVYSLIHFNPIDILYSSGLLLFKV